MKDYLNLKNSHLIISVVIVVPTAFVYGALTTTRLTDFLDIQADTIDLANFLRAIMCLYLGMAIIWILGILKPNIWYPATVLNIVFMGSLALGRIISMVVDGLPTDGYLYGTVGELVLALFGIFQLWKFGK